MREPRFRFWLPDKELMLYNVPYTNRDFEHDIVPMLFTQVYDSNSERIYEGDFIECCEHYGYKYTYEVFFSQGAFYAKSVGNGFTPLLSNLTQMYNTEVVGNVYQHAEGLHPIMHDSRSSSFKKEYAED